MVGKDTTFTPPHSTHLARNNAVNLLNQSIAEQRYAG